MSIQLYVYQFKLQQFQKREPIMYPSFCLFDRRVGFGWFNTFHHRFDLILWAKSAKGFILLLPAQVWLIIFEHYQTLPDYASLLLPSNHSITSLLWSTPNLLGQVICTNISSPTETGAASYFYDLSATGVSTSGCYNAYNKFPGRSVYQFLNCGYQRWGQRWNVSRVTSATEWRRLSLQYDVN